MIRSHIALAGTIAALLIPIQAQTRKKPAPIVDGPDYLASQGQTAAPAAEPAPDNPTCLAAMQVIGHDGEAIIAVGSAVRDRDELQKALDQATMAELLVNVTKRVIANDGSYCQDLMKNVPRLYPPTLDQHDHMSTGRLIMVLNMLRITAATKGQLEAQASQDISH